MPLAAALAALMTAAVAHAALTAEFTWQPTAPAPGQEVTFTSTSQGAVKYDWDLNGDGTYEITNGAATVKHTYSAAGTYHVRLRVTASDNSTATRTHDVHVSTGMQASFTWSPQSPYLNQKVTFSSTSTIKSGSITKYEWDLNGDRKFGDATGPTASTTFTKTGAHTVGLRTTDNTGAHAFTFDTVQVGSAPAPAPAPQPQPGPAPAPAPTDQPASGPAPPAGSSGPAWLNPFPTVRIRGRATSGGVHLSLLAVRAPAGSSVKVVCRGKHCGHHVLRRTMKTNRIRLRAFERFLPAKTKLSIFIWKKGMVGKFTSFKMRPLVAPRRADMCLYPGGRWPGACPR
jgi:PKD repeat protein